MTKQTATVKFVDADTGSDAGASLKVVGGVIAVLIWVTEHDDIEFGLTAVAARELASALTRAAERAESVAQ